MPTATSRAAVDCVTMDHWLTIRHRLTLRQGLTMRRKMFRAAILIGLLALADLWTCRLAMATVLNPGDILMIDFRNGVFLGPADHALFQINPTTGDREIVSGMGVGSGEDVSGMIGLGVSAGGQIYVTDIGDHPTAGAVLRIDPASGNRELISGRGRGSGPSFRGLFGGPTGIALSGDGSLLVADVAEDIFGPPGTGVIYRVDPATGNRTVVSGQGVGTGPALIAPFELSLESSGSLLLTDDGRIVRIDLATGDRSLILDAPGVRFDGLGVVQGNSILAGGRTTASPTDRPVLARVDLTSGSWEVVSGWTAGGIVGSGPLSEVTFQDVSLLATGEIVAGGGINGVFAMMVDEATGNRTVLSGSLLFEPPLTGAGPLVAWPGTLAIYQVPEPDGLVLAILGAIAAAAFRW